MRNLSFTIKGINCGACIKIINKKLSSVPGIESVNIELNGKAELSTSTNLNIEEIKKVLEEIGYAIEK